MYLSSLLSPTMQGKRGPVQRSKTAVPTFHRGGTTSATVVASPDSPFFLTPGIRPLSADRGRSFGADWTTPLEHTRSAHVGGQAPVRLAVTLPTASSLSAYTPGGNSPEAPPGFFTSAGFNFLGGCRDDLTPTTSATRYSSRPDIACSDTDSPTSTKTPGSEASSTDQSSSITRASLRDEPAEDLRPRSSSLHAAELRDLPSASALNPTTSAKPRGRHGRMMDSDRSQNMLAAMPKRASRRVRSTGTEQPPELPQQQIPSSPVERRRHWGVINPPSFSPLGLLIEASPVRGAVHRSSSRTPSNSEGRQPNRPLIRSTEGRRSRRLVYSPAEMRTASYSTGQVMSITSLLGTAQPSPVPRSPDASAVGIADEVLDLLPISKFDFARHPHICEEHIQCMICLEEFHNGESLRWLPCLHHFHCGCIDTWLRSARTCPICKCDVEKVHQASKTAKATHQMTIRPRVPRQVYRPNAVVPLDLSPRFWLASEQRSSNRQSIPSARLRAA